MKLGVWVSALAVLAGVVLAAPQANFDPKDVVRHVRQSAAGPQGSMTAGLDEGEFLVDTVIASVAAPGDQVTPAIACDGVGYFVAWQDGRGGGHICGARVTADGCVLDTHGILISAPGGTPYSVALAFDGTNFLAVWGDRRSGDSDIYGARIAPSGVVLDPQGIAISTAVGRQRRPALACDGMNCLVVWEDYRNDPDNPDVYGARVTTAGAVLDPDGVVISQASRGQRVPDVAWDGASFLVVWEAGRGGYPDIYGARVSAAGVVLDPQGFAISQASLDQKGSSLFPVGRSLIASVPSVRLMDARYPVTSRCFGRSSALAGRVVQA